MNSSPHHHQQRHDSDHDVHQQSLLWFFRFCNQRSSSSSSSSGSSSNGSLRAGSSSRRKATASRNKFAAAYQQRLLQQQRQSSNVFGRDLIEHTQLFSDQDSIPHIVKSCAKFIEKHGIIFGIYRLSGMRANIYKLRKNFDDNPKISTIDTETISNDAHAVACVLKQYFRELPTPLLTFHMYEKFIGLFKQSGCNIDSDHDNDSNIVCNNTENNDKPIISNFNGEEPESRLDDELARPTTATTTTTTAVATTTNTPNSDNYINRSNNNINIISTSNIHTTTVKSSSSESQTTTTTTTTTSEAETPKLKQTQLTPSTSDSQLISLSSVVATNTSDLKYQFKLGDLRKLLQQLPNAHYQTLKYLMSHLARVAASGTRTGMDSKNVAIVWAPNLLKPRELELSAGLETWKTLGLQALITEQLIKHHQFLFDEDDSVHNMNK